MHARMDRMKTLRFLLLIVALIYFAERGIGKICQPISGLITQSAQAGTHFIIAMNAAGEKDRMDAESFQRAMDRHNKVATFVWKRPQGRDLSDRPDEFTASEIAQSKKSFNRNLAKND